MNFKTFILLFFLFINIKNTIAQQCAYTNHAAIVINLITTKGSHSLKNIKLTLCNKTGNAFTDYNWNCKNNTELGQLDSFVFWKNNTLPNRKARSCADKFMRQIFKGLSNYYFCIVPTYTGSNDYLIQNRNFLPSNVDVLNRKISIDNKDVFLYVKISGDNINEQILKIPSEVLYNICACHLYSALSLCEIKPINIVLDNNQTAKIQDDRFGVIQVNESEQMIENFSFDGELTTKLKQVHLLDEETGLVLQSIPNKKEMFKNKVYNDNGELKFYSTERSKNKVPHPSLIVPATIRNNREHTLLGKNYRCAIIYSFNEANKRFEIDTLLSKPDYISITYDKINPNFNGTNGVDIWESDSGLVFQYYKLINNKWENTSQELEIKKEVEKENDFHIQNQKTPNCVFYDKEHHKPVFYFTEDAFTILDTFYIYNAGNATANLKKTYGDYFTISNKIKPNTKVPIYYSRTFNKKKLKFWSALQSYAENVVIEFDSNKTCNAYLQYDIISPDASSKIQVDGSKVFYYLIDQTQFNEIQLDTNNNLIATGNRLILDSTQIGMWNYKNPITKSNTQQQHKKAIRLQIMPEQYINNCIITLIDTNGLKKVIPPSNNRNKVFYIDEKIRSIQAQADSAQGSFIVNFASLQQNDYAVIYLIKPTDMFYYYGKTRIPFNFNSTQYFINWHSSKNLNQDLKYLQILQANFPKLIVHYADRNSRTDFIDIINMNDNEKKIFLNYVKESKNIQFISQLWESGVTTYCGNTVIIYIDHKNISAQKLEEAKQLGFVFEHTNYGMSEVYSVFKYDGTILDNTFITKYNQLVALIGFEKSSLNIYRQFVEETLKNKQ